MATQQKIGYRTHQVFGRVLLASVIAGATGCAVDPVFAHRFDHCMNYWIAQERGLRMSVMPEGDTKASFCMDWANRGVGIGVLTATNTYKQPAVGREG